MDCRICYKYILFECLKVSRTTNTQRDELFFVIRKTVLDISKTTNKQMSDCGFFWIT